MAYALTTFLSAFLLFMVQPMMGKLLLPWFGGAPAVWTTCMLFFQVLLLAGYGYAHWLGRWCSIKLQSWVHSGLLILAVMVMAWWWRQWGSPLLPDGAWKPKGDEAAVPLILGTLAAAVGLPYLLLSATSPLLQRWFSRDRGDRSAYRLYAVSNAGSLLGLLSYPLLTERLLPLPAQAFGWSAVFLVFSAACAWCAYSWSGEMGDRRGREQPSNTISAPPGWSTVAVWLLLTFSTSAMLLSVTNLLCQEVAAVPMLWVVPLAIYLVSFIICFDRPQWYRRRVFVPISVVATFVVLVTAFLGIKLKIPVHIATSSAFLFVFCMTCHGELVRLRPGAAHLTFFYLMVALGGALGGVFVGIAAPAWFTHYWEFNIVVTAAWVALAWIWAREKGSFFHTGDRWQFWLFIALVLYVAMRVTLTVWRAAREALPGWALTLWFSGIFAVGISGLILWMTRRSALAAHHYWPRLLVGAIIFVAECFMVVKIRTIAHDGTILKESRNFFGTLRITQFREKQNTPSIRQLTHGQINHGYQYLDEELGRQPVSYYGKGSGLELAIHRHPRQVPGPVRARAPMRIGVLGLGVGTVAAFARPEDEVVFYEINPTVIDYAVGDDAFFNYLKDCPGRAEVVRGDARLSLERELEKDGSRQFDVLVMDAFSSDSVPVHLMTREAMALYSLHLRDESSVLALNISNRFLDFKDLAASLADELGMEAWFVLNPGVSLLSGPSEWMLLTRSPELGKAISNEQGTGRWHARQRVVWTDDFSSIFPILR